MLQHPLQWYARDDLKILNAIAREYFDFVSLIYDHPKHSQFVVQNAKKDHRTLFKQPKSDWI